MDYRSQYGVFVKMSPVERFWAKVQKCDGDGCWLWLGTKTWQGYGIVHLRMDGRATTTHASRFSYELTHGPIGDSKMYVCHACDNPSCVRPDHMFLGTNTDNQRDAQRKGRQRVKRPRVRLGFARGEQHHNASLTEAGVRDIRKRYAEGGVSYSQLGREYGVYQSTIYKIVKRLYWKWAA